MHSTEYNFPVVIEVSVEEQELENDFSRYDAIEWKGRICHQTVGKFRQTAVELAKTRLRRLVNVSPDEDIVNVLCHIITPTPGHKLDTINGSLWYNVMCKSDNVPLKLQIDSYGRIKAKEYNFELDYYVAESENDSEVESVDDEAEASLVDSGAEKATVKDDGQDSNAEAVAKDTHKDEAESTTSNFGFLSILAIAAKQLSDGAFSKKVVESADDSADKAATVPNDASFTSTSPSGPVNDDGVENTANDDSGKASIETVDEPNEFEDPGDEHDESDDLDDDLARHIRQLPVPRAPRDPAAEMKEDTLDRMSRMFENSPSCNAARELNSLVTYYGYDNFPSSVVDDFAFAIQGREDLRTMLYDHLCRFINEWSIEIHPSTPRLSPDSQFRKLVDELNWDEWVDCYHEIAKTYMKRS